MAEEKSGAEDASRSFRAVRSRTKNLADLLSAEDQQVQSMPDASPTKWHLAHTTWFFERFVLREFLADYRPFDDSFEQLFNSYYNSVGVPFPRHQRGLLTRPSAAQVLDYRAHVDDAISVLLSSSSPTRVKERIAVGLHHEMQHQELILTDIKHALAQHPLPSAYASEPLPPESGRTALDFVSFPEAMRDIGRSGGGFYFDNEGPEHRQWVPAFQLATRPVIWAEVLEFITAGGYRDPLLWLSDGWNHIQALGIERPLYLRQVDGQWLEFTLHGSQPLCLDAPACHLTYFEADAVARFLGARLPTEAEWEVAARVAESQGERPEVEGCDPEVAMALHPRFCLQKSRPSTSSFRLLFGGVWEWTRSAYGPYPGFVPEAGAVGEYNGKFMHGQQVLRGGSCVTPVGHLRTTYRNFFPSHAAWQFSGLRLAKDVKNHRAQPAPMDIGKDGLK